MALIAEQKMQNVKASIEKYIGDNLVIIEGFKINYEGDPFEIGDKDEWIEETIIGKGAGDYHRQVSSTQDGQTSPIILNFNTFVVKEKTEKTNRHYEIRDIIADYFKIGIEIDLYDFTNDDFITSLQKMKIREIVTDQSIPDDTYYQYTYTISLDWLEKWT